MQQQAQSASTPSFEAALVLNAVVFGAELLAFSLLRKHFKTIYEPRTFLTPEKYVQTFVLAVSAHVQHSKRVPPLPSAPFAWPLAVWNSDPEVVRVQNGLDAYMFLRFLRSQFLRFISVLPLTPSQ